MLDSNILIDWLDATILYAQENIKNATNETSYLSGYHSAELDLCNELKEKIKEWENAKPD